MAGRALPGTDGQIRVEPQSLVNNPERRQMIMEAAAKLYGQGFKRSHIAKLLVDHLTPNKFFEDGTPRPLEQRTSQARARLRGWERDPKFRDLVYNGSIVKLDLQTPAILDGIAKKAKKGRVDAARLVLELTGRHNPKGEQQPTQVALILSGVPRPATVQAVTADGTETIEIADGSMAEEDADV